MINAIVGKKIVKTAQEVCTGNVIEKLINDSYSDTVSSLTPSTLYIDRDGSLALLFDDANDPDEGIAVCLSPKEKILSQDEFL